MSRFVSIKQSLLIAFNFILVLFAINSVYSCLLESSVGANCGISFTFTVIPLFVVSLIVSSIWCLLTFKKSKLQSQMFIFVVFVMWLLAYVFSYLKINNYL